MDFNFFFFVWLDTLITINSGNHHYKEYLKTYLSYDEQYKKSVLSSSGWYSEDPASKGSIRDNKAFFKRLRHFAQVDEKLSTVKKYNDTASTLFGSIGTDFAGTVLNGVSIRLTYQLADPKFFLWGKRKDGTPLDQKFDIAIDKFVLHSCSRDITPDLYETIEKRLQTEPAVLPYKRYHLTPFTISQGLLEYINDAVIVSPVIVPCRAFFCLVPSRLYDADYGSDPYVFGFRKTVQENVVSNVQNTQPSTTTTTGDAVAAAKSATGAETSESTVDEELDQLLVISAMPAAKESLENEVVKFQVTMNGVDIDGLNSSSLEEMAFFRLNKYLGYLNSHNSNSISLEEFKNGSQIFAFDFSTSLSTSNDFLVPSVKSGHLRASIQFRTPTKEPYHLLVLSEYDSLITISSSERGRIIGTNYTI